MKKFEILITDVPDRENLVAEVWYGETLIAEINQETKKLEIEFYLNEKIAFDLNEFLTALENAKGLLIKNTE
ncbi:hypothetical protein [Chryseobacterium shandongense]|jgi:hypothetical protein|uniref:hypothetical protein n=1 Tax=Chryseobacterium shandongense TaxID=1493872 RepID=UPI000F514F53|nr:hypothetical protein [Chryseobacterium shandongense]AZA57265.1 hypothetical protein EG350_08765 [Chryseobacterium shandongense]